MSSPLCLWGGSTAVPTAVPTAVCLPFVHYSGPVDMCLSSSGLQAKDSVAERIREKIKNLAVPDAVKTVINEELDRLQTLESSSSEFKYVLLSVPPYRVCVF